MLEDADAGQVLATITETIMPHEKTTDKAELLRQVAEWNQRSYMAAQPQGNEAELRRLIIEWIKAQYECLVPSSQTQTRKDYLAFNKTQAALRKAVTGKEDILDAARVLATVDSDTIDDVRAMGPSASKHTRRKRLVRKTGRRPKGHSAA